MSIDFFVVKRAHLRVNNNEKAYELWNGRPSLVKYFNIFVIKCYIKINDNNLGKFNSRVDEGIILGYSTKSKACKCYNKILSD